MNHYNRTSSTSLMLDRVRVQVEILCENLSDCFCGGDDQPSGSMNNYDYDSGSDSGGGCSLNRILKILAGIAFFVTLRSARRGVQKMKHKGGYSGSSSFYSPYKSSAYGGSSLGRSTTSYGAGSSYGAKTTPGAYGSTTGGTSSMYGTGATTRSTMGGYGSTTGTFTMMGGSVQQQGSSTGTADLADRHGAAIQVMENNLFKSYGGIISFGGAIETLQAYEGSGVVDKVLQSPGNGKVLVVDGGGSTRCAIFDGQAAATAQRSGWAGVIVNGAIRNAHKISTTSIGVMALGTHPVKGKATSGSKGTVLNIGGLQFQPNMHVHADKDGIIISQQPLTGGGATTMMGGGGATNSMMGTTSTSTAGGFGGNTGMATTGMTNTMGSNTMMGGAATTAGGYGTTAGIAGGYGSTGATAPGAGGYGATAGGYGSTAGGYGSTTPGGYSSTLRGTTGSSTGNFYGSGGSSGYGAGSYGTSGYGGTSQQQNQKKGWLW